MTVDGAALFRRYGSMVHRRALAILRHRTDAEDATQEVFLCALRSLETFDGRSQISTWLYRITTNVCLNVLRTRRLRSSALARERTLDEQKAPSPPPIAELLALRELLFDSGERLSQAALCVHVDGMSQEEAAKLLCISRRTLGRLLEEFHQMARNRIGEREEPPA